MSITDLASGTRATIGRYFSLVSVVPSAVLTLFVFFLANSGAWRHRPHWAASFHALARISLGTAAALSVISVAVGLAMHPVQFALVQFYEGYWGISTLAERARLARALQYRDRATAADVTVQGAEIQLGRLRLSTAERLWLAGWRMEASRLQANYPPVLPTQVSPDLPFMPTRLGNVLRRYEMLAGAPYGLEAVQAIPYLALVARAEDVRYLDDQRGNLDLAVRLSATSLLATLISVVFLWNDGLWLLIALVPYGLAYLFYRGSIVVAHEYGVAMATLIALNRFALYERMGIRRPDRSTEERKANAAGLGDLLSLNPRARQRYVRPGPGNSAEAAGDSAGLASPE